MLHRLRKAYFEILFMCFRVLYLTKLIFGFHVQNIDISCTYLLDSVHTQYALKEFKYLIFVFIQVWEKSDFHFKIWFSKIPILC